MNCRIILLIVSVFCLFVSLPASAKSAASSSDDSSSSAIFSKPIIVRASRPEITFSLKSNPSTGYSWFLSSYNGRLVMPLKHKHNRSLNKLAGAPGISVWVFRIRERAFFVPTITKITMTYARPWDLTGAKTKVITVIALP